MVYGRKYDDRELNFEASGALMDATLVMRDRETDSWWSIITSDAIGGELEGDQLVELPLGEKSTWKSWVARHPETLVLSVEGREHEENNPYDNYLTSDGTFRGLEIDDERLAPKANIYSFWLLDRPFASPHEAFEGGKIFAVEGLEGRKVFLHRPRGASMFQSSHAYLVAEQTASRDLDPDEMLELARAGDSGFEILPGFDTFWYSWIAINENSELLQ